MLFLQNKILKNLANFFSFRKKNIKTILIHRVGSIGDTVSALPAIFHLKKNYKNSKIIILYCSDDISFQKFNFFTKDYIDDYIAYSLKSLNILEIFKLIYKLRKLKLDLWLALPQDLTNFRSELRNLIFSLFSASKIRYGFEVTRNVNHKNDKIIKKFINEKKRLINIVNRFTNSDFKFNPEVNLYLNTKDFYLSNKYLSIEVGNSKTLAVCISSNRKGNKWDINNYIYIANKWIQNNGNVLLIGGPKEFNEANIFIKHIKKSKYVINLVGKNNLKETIYFLMKCKFLLSNDTGIIHIADLLNLNIIGIYSSREHPYKWFPANNRSQVFMPKINCDDCWQKESCPNKCINTIDKIDVWQKIMEYS